MSNYKQAFPNDGNLEPNDYWKSKRFKVEESGEIKSDKPIQVRINNGPWIDVRSLDLNKDKK
ncbi:MAG: hypothetical protein CL961_00045 [Euryarchaeota archaeon]|nr:hypothetical protein [Euryarchaeota archaeon]